MATALNRWLARQGEPPTTIDLASYVERVESTAAPGESWDVRADHTAPARPSQPPAAPTAGPSPEVATVTLPTAPPTARASRTRWRDALILAGVAGLGATLFLWLGVPQKNAERDRSLAVSAGRPTMATTPPSRPMPAATLAPSAIPADRPAEASETTRPPSATAPGVAPPVPPVPAARKAELSVNSQPWSNVTLDGRAIGQTPIRDLRIAAGRHKLVLTNPVRQSSREVVFTVKPGEKKLIREVF